MTKRLSPSRTFIFLAGLVALTPVRMSAAAPDPFSPDGQWEYKCVDGWWSEIHKTDTGKMVLDLSNAVEVPHCNDAEVLWSPDSKRFAFNHSPPHVPHTTYNTIAFFELRDGEWVAMPPLLDESDVSQLVQLAKEKLPKALRKRKDLYRDVLKVRNWIDSNTAILYGYTIWERDQPKAAFLFTVKFDANGNPKVIKTQHLPDKEVEQ